MIYNEFMWIILGFLFSVSVFALESFESISNVKILRILPDNIAVLNRGLEDGIMRNDHAKLSNEVSGFSARALCIKVAGEMSYWKLYRVPNSEAFSLDYTYTIKGMADKEIPFPALKLRDSVQVISDLDQKKTEGAGADPFAVKSDLPERLTEQDLIETVGRPKR
jgi:hypothetical protein